MTNEQLRFQSLDVGTVVEYENNSSPYFLASVYIVLIGAKFPENNGFSSSSSNFCVQLKFENQKFTSESRPLSLKPKWFEETEFKWRNVNNKLLEINLLINNEINKSFEISLNLLLFDLAVNNQLKIDFPNGAGTIEFNLTICCFDPFLKYKFNEIQSFNKAFKNILNRTFPKNVHLKKDLYPVLGVLYIRIIKSKGLLENNTEPESFYCVIQLVNTRLRTKSTFDHHITYWNEEYRVKVYDLFETLEVSVYKDNEENEYIGCAYIPLVNIRNNLTTWYWLKDRAFQPIKSKKIQLKMSLYCNLLKSSLRTLYPQEKKAYEARSKLEFKNLKLTLARCIRIRKIMKQKLNRIKALLNWEHFFLSLMSFVASLTCVMYIEAYMVPTLFIVVLLCTFVFQCIYQKHEDTPLEEDIDDKEQTSRGGILVDKQSTVTNLGVIKVITGIEKQLLQVEIQTKNYIRIMERIESAFSWKSPQLNVVAIIYLLIGTFAIYNLSLRYFIFGLLFKRYLKGFIFKHVDSGLTICKFLSRYPTLVQLTKYKNTYDF